MTAEVGIRTGEDDPDVIEDLLKVVSQFGKEYVEPIVAEWGNDP
jgi:hypothetical protein